MYHFLRFCILQCAPSHIGAIVCAICSSSNSQWAWQELEFATVDSLRREALAGTISHTGTSLLGPGIRLPSPHPSSSASLGALPHLKHDTAVPCISPSLSLSRSDCLCGPSGLVMLAQQGAGEHNKVRPFNSIVFTMAN